MTLMDNFCSLLAFYLTDHLHRKSIEFGHIFEHCVTTEDFMLEYKWIKNSKEKVALLKNFDAELGLWLIPHSQIKYDLQNYYIRSQKNLIGDPFKTSTEFWQDILLQIHPELQIVNKKVMQVFIKKELQTKQEKWCHFPGSAHQVFDLLSHILPILSHIEGPELLSQWITTHITEQKRKYFLEALKIWQKIDGQFITSSWIPSLLSHTSVKPLNLRQKKIIVDLGCHLLPTELEIFEQLSEKKHVMILVPHPSWNLKYPNELATYEMATYFQKDQTASENLPFNTSQRVKTKRFASMLAEVKDATATIRHWIEQGTPPHQILICCPDTRVYWPILKEYLDFEGIPFNQVLTDPLSTLPDISRWLARIQVQIKSYADFHTLELAVFKDQKQQNFLPYQQFHHIYSQVLETSDYQRSKTVYQLIEKNAISKKKEYDPLFFLAYTLKLWQPSSSLRSVEGLTHLLKTFIENTRPLPPLKASYWLEVLEHLVSTTRLPVQNFLFQGISILDLSCSAFLPFQKVYIMGLSEQALKKTNLSLLSHLDVLSIRSQLGFSLDLTEKSTLEFQTDEILSEPQIDKVASFPETNFSGEVLTPSLLWLRSSQGKSLEKPSPTLWDTWKNQKTSKILQKASGRQPADLPDCPNYQPSCLSVSSLERYHTCPFIFYAENILQLKSTSPLDVDATALDKGLFLHKLLCDLTQEPFKPLRSDKELDEMIENYLKQHYIVPAFKEEFKQVQIQTLQKFLEFENRWRENFPQTKTVFREEDIFIYIHPQTGVFSTTEQEGAILIKGRIDRLDQVGNALCLIDYKTSLYRQTSYKKWLDKGKFQLGLYALMLREGSLNISGEIASAVYFGVKELNRDKGFLLKEYNKLAYHIKPRSHSGIDRGQQEKLFKNFKEKITDIVSLIQQGFFPANPQDKKTCVKCPWRNVCQAPHLM